MKKYSSGSFIDAAVRVYGSEADTITSFPASIIANGGNITPWTVYGNTVEGVSVGEQTKNKFDKDNFTFGTGTTIVYVPLYVGEGTFTLSTNFPDDDAKDVFFLPGSVTTGASSAYNGVSEGHPLSRESIDGYVTVATRYNTARPKPSDYNYMLNAGSTALPFEPYGYNVIISCGDTDYNCYISDVLRKSSGADPVYDIMSSTGTITRNVDTDGTPLLTPRTESFTAPTLATVAGSQSVSFGTTVKPSKAELTYTGWHTHSDKKRSGGAWT